MLIFVSTGAALTRLSGLQLRCVLLYDRVDDPLLSFWGRDGLRLARDGLLEAFVEVSLQVTIAVNSLVLVLHMDCQ